MPTASSTEKLQAVQNRIRSDLIKHGTNVAKNEQDPQGDGDQSLITCARHQQFYRDLFATGGDFFECLNTTGHLSKFALSCVMGAASAVKEMLQEADNCEQEGLASAELISLLETRETSMRITPLMMLASIGKNVSFSEDDTGLRQRQTAVADVLLSFGARPDAKDVTGKTICHYGAGAMATQTTLDIVMRAARAHPSCHLFNKQVRMEGLQSKPQMNGLLGIARGFDTTKGRRAVYVYDLKKQVLLKPENIKLVGFDVDSSSTDEATPAPVRNLCDVPCRLGMTSLLETIPAKRDDVAKFLLETLHASIDISDCDGMTARTMAMAPMAEMASSVATIIKNVARKQGKKLLKQCRCFQCQIEGNDFQQCSKCVAAFYCSRDCQVQHWPTHKEECKKLRKKTASFKLERPPSDGSFSTTFNMRSGATYGGAQRESEGYRKPSNVAVGEQFYVKCQGGGPAMPLMIYDESRQCNFSYSPQLTNFEKLRSVIAAEPAFQGRKTYMLASFDENGDCTMYPSSTTLKRW